MRGSPLCGPQGAAGQIIRQQSVGVLWARGGTQSLSTMVERRMVLKREFYLMEGAEAKGRFGGENIV